MTVKAVIHDNDKAVVSMVVYFNDENEESRILRPDSHASLCASALPPR